MKVLNERVLGVQGPWLIKGRYVQYSTREQGTFHRPELVFEKQPGIQQGLEVGFSLEDIGRFQALLKQYAVENYHSTS